MPMFIHHDRLAVAGLKTPIYFCFPCWDIWHVSPHAASRPLEAIDADEGKHKIKHLQHYRAALEKFLGKPLK